MLLVLAVQAAALAPAPSAAATGGWPSRSPPSSPPDCSPTLLFGAVLLGPLSALTAAGGPLDRRWTMIGADGVRLALFVVAPLWINWVPGSAVVWLLVTVFVAGVAERLWTVVQGRRRPRAAAAARAAPPCGRRPTTWRTLRRLDLRTGFVALPVAAAALVVVTLVNKLLGVGVDLVRPAPGRAGVVRRRRTVLGLDRHPLLPRTAPGSAPRPRSPLEGLRLPKGPAGAERGRTGALPLLVLASAAVAGAIAAAVAVAVLHASDLGGGPVGFGLLVLALTGGTVVGIRTAPGCCPRCRGAACWPWPSASPASRCCSPAWSPTRPRVLLLALLAGIAAGVDRQHRARPHRPGGRGGTPGPHHRATCTPSSARRPRRRRRRRPAAGRRDRPAPRRATATSPSPTAAPRTP